jgi:hypothetical protein
MPDNIIEKIKKVKALADSGTDGVAIEAQRRLLLLLEKYDIEYEDIFNEDVLHEHDIYVKKPHMFLFCQIYGMVVKDYEARPVKRYVRGRSKKVINVTDFEFIQIMNMYEFYLAQYKKEEAKQLKMLHVAFCTKNHLLVESNKDDNYETPYDMSDIETILSMMNSMESRHYHKQIQNQ